MLYIFYLLYDNIYVYFASVYETYTYIYETKYIMGWISCTNTLMNKTKAYNNEEEEMVNVIDKKDNLVKS